MKLAHSEYGQGEQTIVLIHGWGFHRGVWHQLALRLQKNYRVIAIDLPGHGESDAFAFDDWLPAMIDCLREQTCHVLGWSLGGLLATQLIQRVPEKIASLATCATNPQFIADDDWPGVEFAVFQQLKKQVDDNTERAVKSFMMIGDVERQQIMPLLKIQKQATVPDVGCLQQGLSCMQHHALQNDWVKLDCPQWHAYGSLDGLVPLSIYQRVNDLHANCHTVLFDQSGHAPFITEQNTFLAQYRHFLETKL